MTKKILLLPLLALTYLLSLPAFANIDNSTPSKACPCKQRMEKMTQDLNLSSDQQAKIKAIKSANKDQMKANWKQMKSLRSQMNTLSMAPSVDETKLNDLISQKNALMATMTKNRIMMKNQIFNILTPKQQQQYQAIMKNWEAKNITMHGKCAG